MTKKSTAKEKKATFEGSITPMFKTQEFFFVVAENNKNNTPTKKHTSELDALQEAIRISNKEKCECYITKCVKVVHLIPFIETIK